MLARWLGPRTTEFQKPEGGLAVPSGLNTLLVITVWTGMTGLLWVGSHLESPWALGAAAVVFAYLMLTVYALLHEGTHDVLHSHPAANYTLGVITGLLFPVPFSLAHTTHQGHHLRNRTDFEMFDMYYPAGSRWIRRIQWYGTLCGTFYPTALLATVLLTVAPWSLGTRPFRRAMSTAYIVKDILNPRVIRLARIESAVIVAWYVGLHQVLELDWRRSLAMFMVAGVNWSTRQYIDHAYTRRHVIEGAHNLKAPRLLEWITLNGNYNLTHHRHPEVPWIHLPAITDLSVPRPGYYRQYLEMWRRGPVMAPEPAPSALTALPLTVFPQARL